MQNNVYQVKLSAFQKLPRIDQQGIYNLANEMIGLFKLKKRNFDKYAAKYPDGDSLLKEFKLGKANRVHLELACCLTLGKDTLDGKERGRLRQIIDGQLTVSKALDVVQHKTKSLQWNKQAMTTAHTSHRGAYTGKVTANYKKK